MTTVTELIVNSISPLDPSTFLLSLVVLCLLSALVYYSTMSQRSSRPLPPGPRGFPILGVLPLMGDQPQHTVQRWWHQYGDVMSVYMGSRLVLIVSGMEAMKECFVRQSDVFSGRPNNYFKRVTKGKGLVFSEGDTWKEHRRFTLSCLRDFGMGKVVLQHKVHDEVGYLLRALDSAATTSDPVDPGTWLPQAVANIICSVIYGTRFEYDDEAFRDNVFNLNESTRNQTLTTLVNFIPWLEFLPTLLPMERKLKENISRRAIYAQQQIDERHVSGNTDNPRDFIEAYLSRMKSLNSQRQKTTLDESQLHRTIQDLFIAGTESVSTTLKWTILFMALHTDVQEKVQQEIDSVIVGNRMPSMSDKVSLPFTEATLMECQRVGNITLFNVPRCTMVDTTVNGYHVPRGTWVFANRWGVHSSTRYWRDPTKFDPSRFLDQHGKVLHNEALVPFGIGPRSCLGESLAKMELFLFFSCLLRSFSFRLPPGKHSNDVDMKPKIGLTLCPQPYKVVVTKRK